MVYENGVTSEALMRVDGVQYRFGLVKKGVVKRVGLKEQGVAEVLLQIAARDGSG